VKPVSKGFRDSGGIQRKYEFSNGIEQNETLVVHRGWKFGAEVGGMTNSLNTVLWWAGLHLLNVEKEILNGGSEMKEMASLVLNFSERFVGGGSGNVGGRWRVELTVQKYR
jgi:hypothetical protein